MSRGFLVDSISPLASIINLGESIRWTPGEEDILIGKKVATIAYACPKCGYIEQYVRNLEQNREIIQNALKHASKKNTNSLYYPTA